MEYLIASKMQYVLWAAAAFMVLFPGVACLWVARRFSGIRLAAAGASTSRGRRMRSIDRIDERLNHVCTAMSLLTDSTESALRDTITEIERLSRATSVPPARQRAAVQRRVKGAAQRGRTTQEIAVAEGVSEGEVRLRLGLLNNTAVEAMANAEMR